MKSPPYSSYVGVRLILNLAAVVYSSRLAWTRDCCLVPHSTAALLPLFRRLDKPGSRVLPRYDGTRGYTACSEGDRLPSGSDRCLDLDWLGP